MSSINSAIRKLSDVALPSDYEKPLYRAVRGELPTVFWLPDERGHVAATDFGFMSTSRETATGIRYMSNDAEEQNVLWEVCPAAPTSEAFHFGADVSMLSQFDHESEVLFPPGAAAVERAWALAYNPC